MLQPPVQKLVATFIFAHSRANMQIKSYIVHQRHPAILEMDGGAFLCAENGKTYGECKKRNTPGGESICLLLGGSVWLGNFQSLQIFCCLFAVNVLS